MVVKAHPIAQYAFALSVLVAFSHARADVSFYPSRPAPEHGPKARSVASIAITGVIRSSDNAEFNNVLQLLRADLEIHGTKNALLVVQLDSSGGDVETAIALGKQIRELFGYVQIPHQAQCLSSCVLILAAGAYRDVKGVVGIHRPFMPTDSAVTAEQQHAQQERLAKSVKAYLQKMNVPLVLYEQMVRIPPQRIKVLSNDELSALGLNENDPYIDDALTAAAAKREGLTKEQYFRYEDAVRTSCAGIVVLSDYQNCRKAVRARF
jgi:hypothetical protein